MNDSCDVGKHVAGTDFVVRPYGARTQGDSREAAAEQAAPRLRPWLRAGIRPLAALDLAACLVVGVVLGTPAWLTAVFALLVVTTFAGAGLYRSRLTLSVLDDLATMASRWLAAFTGTAAVVVVSAALRPDVSTWPTEADAVVLALVAGAALVGTRAVAYTGVRQLRARRVIAHHTLVLGAGEIGRRVAHALLDHPEYGLLPVGFVDDRRDQARLPLPVVASNQDLARALELPELRAVVLAYGRLPETQLVEVIRACHRHSYEVFVVPRLYEVHHVARDMELVWGTPLVRLRRAAYRSPAWHLKRLLDVAVASVALLLLSPLLLAIAAAVRLEGRDVIFRQERVGCDGRRFTLMKFRSMRPADERESATQWNIGSDHRVGRIGRFLRVTSLDELPQLFNILNGDMSLVGPRPERPHFVEEFRARYPSYHARLRVPCGLTGWAQVHGLRGDTSIEERARFDNFYIENWSFGLDLKIILMTVASLFRSPGS
jgi:exopolysaccharide biosynthesis polyprenyl glycosylphosphotransferase